MTSSRLPSRIIATAVLALGLFGLWLLVTLLVTIGCAFEGTCSVGENGVVVVVAVACVAGFAWAMWRIWRR